MSDQDYPLPPATFEFLVLSLRTQTEMHLGLLAPENDQPEPDFRIARHSIDLLAMLQEKTRGNTTLEEQRLIENSLTELRFRYVQAMEQHKKKAAARESAPPEPAGPEPAAPTPAAAPEPEPKKGRTSDQMESEGQAKS